MKALKGFSAALVSVLLASCAAGPDYQPPEIQPPPQFVLQEVLNDLGGGIESKTVPVNWWEGFIDPVLDGLVEDGLENNYSIAAAAARLKAAQARLQIAEAGNDLRVDTVGDSSLGTEVDLTGDTDSSRAYDAFGSIEAFLPVDLFGRTSRRVEAAQAAIEAAEAGLRREILEVSSEIAAEYLRLRGNQRQLELLKESVALQEKTLSIVKSRYESGLSPELDLRRAETSVERLRADIPPLEEELMNSRHRLASLTGRYPGAYEKKLKKVREIPVYRSPVPNVVPLEMLRKRPDIMQAEAVLKQTVANIGVARAEYFPEVELASAISIGAAGATGTPPVDIFIAALSGLIAQTLIDGGIRKADVQIAEAQAEEALALFRQTLLEAVREVEASLAALEASRRSQESLEKAVQASSRSFDQAETLYQQGLISFLDVVDAQRVLADLKQELATERTNYATQIAVLFRTLGAEVRPVSPAAAIDAPA